MEPTKKQAASKRQDPCSLANHHDNMTIIPCWGCQRRRRSDKVKQRKLNISTRGATTTTTKNTTSSFHNASSSNHHPHTEGKPRAAIQNITSTEEDSSTTQQQEEESPRRTTKNKLLRQTRMATEQRLRLLRERRVQGIDCVVCGEIIETKQPIKYRFHEPILQNSNANRALMRLGRRHCQEKHDDIWVWHFVPNSGLTTTTTTTLPTNNEDANSTTTTTTTTTTIFQDAPVDATLHYVLKLANKWSERPNENSPREFSLAFSHRVWNAEHRLRQQRNPAQLDILAGGADNAARTRDIALERLRKIQASAKTHMQSAAFEKTLETKGFEFMLNALLHFFVRFGQYKKCSLFLDETLVSEFADLPERE